MNDVDLRCPQCGALLRGRELWCSLCHADLRPQAAPVTPPPPGVPDPLTAPVEELLAAQAAALDAAPQPVVPAAEALPEPAATARGKHARPGDADEVSGEGELVDPEVMLALLKGDSHDPVLNAFGGRLRDPTARFVVMIGGALLVTGVLFGVYAVLGLIVG